MKAKDLLEFDWEVGVFRALRGLWRAVVPEAPLYDASRAAVLEELRPALTPLAQLIAGEPVRLVAARGGGGVRGRDLIVPRAIDLGPDPTVNRSLLLLRVVQAAAVRKLRLDRDVPTGVLPRLRRELEITEAAIRWLSGDLAQFEAAWREATALVLAARPDPAGLSPQGAWIERARRHLLQTGEAPTAAMWDGVTTLSDRGPGSPCVVLWGGPIAFDDEGEGKGEPGDRSRNPDGTEAVAPAVEDIRRVLIDPKDEEDAVLQHTFEKVETIEKFDGYVRPTDGVDELEEQLEALEEVELGELLRGGEDAHSVLRADLGLGGDIPDVESIQPGEKGIAYDEWDAGADRYRRDWCTVYPTPLGAGDPTWTRGAQARQRQTIARLCRLIDDERHRRSPSARQLDGEEVDLDALVDARAELLAGRPDPRRLYIRSEPRHRELAVTVLLDVSLSADAWVANRRVLDVSRDAVFVLGEVASAVGDPFSVLAFASKTRNRCRVFDVKGWGDSWTTARHRLGHLEPQGYTRIGGPLRHATAQLARRQARKRLLILVSDGKPTDFDRYEGGYGVADIRMAVREAAAVGVTVHALAIDASARETLPQIFGPGGWRLLPTPDHLPTALAGVYGRWSTQ